MRKQLEQAFQEAQYYRDKNRWVREDAADLEYELQLHQRRLANDASQELFFYRTNWEKLEKISDENEESKAKLEAFEQRFAAELEREPCDLPEIRMHTSPSRKRLELNTLRRHWQ